MKKYIFKYIRNCEKCQKNKDSIKPIDERGKTIARIFNNFILIYGPMKTILTDRGSEYVNEVIKRILQLLKIKKKKRAQHFITKHLEFANVFKEHSMNI